MPDQHRLAAQLGPLALLDGGEESVHVEVEDDPIVHDPRILSPDVTRRDENEARLPRGKVPWDVIGDLLGGDLPDPVRLGPAVGEDAALVELGGELWAIATDPVSFTAADAGRLAVTINANDVAVRGARPRWFLAVLLLAHGEATPARVRELIGQIRSACAELGVALIGGHSEVTPGLLHSLVVGTMLGRVEHRPLTTGGLRAGDRIGLVRSAGLEGTAILLAEHGQALRRLHGEAAFAEIERQLADGRWLSVVEPALMAAAEDGVSALHDVTEGGVGEAVHEMAAAAGLAIEARRADVPVLEETARICRDFSLDPLGLIGSGALLVGCAEQGAERLARAYAEQGLPFAWIGRAVEQGEAAATLPRFPRDELLRVSRVEGIDAVIFDMDGTVVDTSYDWAEIRRRLEIEGPSILDHLGSLEPDERARKWALLDEIEREATHDASEMTGTSEVLAHLAECGVRTALVTNNSDGNAQALIERFGLRFDVVVTRDSGVWKPSAAPIELAIRRLGVLPEHCLVVGDSIYDLIAGRAAGCARVAVVHDDTGRLAAEADLAFDDLAALLRYLEITLASPHG
jgi:HAD superfamily hydrolase (TIGR01549 family)